jgi:hypothetical protein
VVPELPAEFLRLRQEVEIAAAEDDEFLRRRRLPAYHQQAARYVIDAVAVRMQWHHAVGVLEQADVIGQPLQMTEWRVGTPQRTGAVALGSCTEPAPAEDVEDRDDPGLIRDSTAERLRENLNAHQRRT